MIDFLKRHRAPLYTGLALFVLLTISVAILGALSGGDGLTP